MCELDRIPDADSDIVYGDILMYDKHIQTLPLSVCLLYSTYCKLVGIPLK